jgi:hypothetical protein
MFVKNPNKINKEALFPCKSNKLKKFLVETKGLQYVTRIFDEKDQKYIWCFIRTEKLGEALIE